MRTQACNQILAEGEQVTKTGIPANVNPISQGCVEMTVQHFGEAIGRATAREVHAPRKAGREKAQQVGELAKQGPLQHQKPAR